MDDATGSPGVMGWGPELRGSTCLDRRTRCPMGANVGTEKDVRFADGKVGVSASDHVW